MLTAKEVAFEVTEVQDFVITFDSADDVRYVQKDESKVYETSISYLDAEALAAEGLNAGDVVPEGGAIKFVGGMENANAMYGAWVKLILSEEELEKVSVATAITFRMYVHPSSYPSWSGQEGFGKGEIDLYEGGNNKTSFIGFDRDTWVDVTISVADLSKEFSTYFNGTNNMFWTSTNTMYDKAGTITYYINSITFDITP